MILKTLARGAALLLSALLFVPSTPARAEEVIPAVSDPSLLANADFHIAGTNGVPGDWERFGDVGAGAVESLAEDGDSFVRLSVDEPGQLVGLSQTVQVPAGALGLEYRDRKSVV